MHKIITLLLNNRPILDVLEFAIAQALLPTPARRVLTIYRNACDIGGTFAAFDNYRVFNKLSAKPLDMRMQGHTKSHQHWCDVSVVLRRNNLGAQVSDFIFHPTHGGRAAHLRHRSATLGYLPDSWNTEHTLNRRPKSIRSVGSPFFYMNSYGRIHDLLYCKFVRLSVMVHQPIPSDWRNLARQVQNEKDPRKFVELAEQLIERLDDELIFSRPAVHTE